MANLVAIDNQHHRNLTLDPKKAELHGAELNLIPVVVGEFTNLAVQYPIVLTKNGDTGQFVFAAMLGFESHENLFWQEGKWQGLYLPLQIQRQPFFIGNSTSENNDSDKEYVVCIDTDSPMVIDSLAENEHSEKLFADEGADSEYFRQAKGTLAHLLQGEVDNERLLSSLKKLDLLQPLSLEIAFINEQTTRLNGLYSIDQDKLASLATDKIAELHQQGLLQPIYTMIASLGQVYALIERKNSCLSDA